MKTRLVNAIQKFFREKGQNLWKNNQFIEGILALLVGFVTGSAFGTVLNYIRALGLWDGVIIFAIVLTAEVLSKRVYRGDPNTRASKFLNTLKLGQFLGFFVDAFKVGS